MRTTLLIILSSLLLTTACEKAAILHKKVHLPAISKEGKNTFGCEINKEVWIPDTGNVPFLAGKINIRYHEPTGILWINIKKRINTTENIETQESEKKWESILITIPHIFAKGDDFIPYITYENQDRAFCSQPNFTIDTNEDYAFEITRFDKEYRIVSGLFYFTLSNNECAPILVKKGRFDLEF